MKTWKDVPHLFCNGKFKVNVNRNSRTADKNPHVFNYFNERVVIWSTAICENVTERIEDCTLIARKIEDMTITEYEDVFYALYGNEEDLYNEYFKHNQLHDFVLMNVNKTPVFLYLLSIGVYPFDQSHFGETVIDINTL